MKTLLIIPLLLLLSYSCFAQNGINYKAVVKDGTGNIIANDIIAVGFTILDGATPVYAESHTVTTDANGLIALNIGEGTPNAGVFADIDWTGNNHFLNVQVNTGGGIQNLGTTKFKTVPYAQIARNVENPIWTLDGPNASFTSGAVNTAAVNVGPNNGNYVFSVLDTVGAANTMRVESNFVGSGNNLIELVIPIPLNGNFIDMNTNGSSVASISSRGEAEFEHVKLNESLSSGAIPDDGVVYRNSMPLAYGYISQSGLIITDFGINSVTKTGGTTGEYEVQLNNQILGSAAIIATTQGISSTGESIRADQINSNRIQFLISDDEGVPRDSAFYFVVYGSLQ